MFRRDRKKASVAACALIVAGGAALWLGFSLAEPAPSAAKKAGGRRVVWRAPQRSIPGPTADELLAFKPPPGHGYSLESDAGVRKVVEHLLARTPEDALRWADAACNPAWRGLLQQMVVQEWAEKDPEAALGWALEQESPGHRQLMDAALLGLATQPQLAVELGRDLLARTPEAAAEFGTVLVGALVRNGQFGAAAELAAAGPDELRSEWMTLTYTNWAQKQPAEAAEALNAIEDPELYAALYPAVITAWAQTQPASLADYARTLPPGDSRVYAMDAALDNWSRQDPAGLANWLAAHRASPEFDAGAAIFLARTDRADRTTATALNWAESIDNDSQRFAALARVTWEWAQQDPMAAQRYVANSPWLNDAQRGWLLNTLNAR